MGAGQGRSVGVGRVGVARAGQGPSKQRPGSSQDLCHLRRVKRPLRAHFVTYAVELILTNSKGYWRMKGSDSWKALCTISGSYHALPPSMPVSTIIILTTAISPSSSSSSLYHYHPHHHHHHHHHQNHYHVIITTTTIITITITTIITINIIFF